MVRIKAVDPLIPIIIVSGILLSFAAWTTAFAQAGSTGGTLGKQDKSLSGERDEQTPAQRRSPAAPKASQHPTVSKEAGCQKIVGTWAYHTPFGTFEVAFKSEGTAISTSGQTASWTCSGDEVTVSWPNGITDRLSLTAGGKRFSGHTALGMSVSGDRD
jgi:hypothetical protein